MLLGETRLYHFVDDGGGSLSDGACHYVCLSTACPSSNVLKQRRLGWLESGTASYDMVTQLACATGVPGQALNYC